MWLAFFNLALLFVLLYCVLLLVDVIVYTIGNRRGTIWLDRTGGPLEFIRGRWFINYLRWRNHVSFGETKSNRMGWYRVGENQLERKTFSEWAVREWKGTRVK